MKDKNKNMNYIVLDLEWNQSPDGKGSSCPDMPFEIIEIGAVKLDGDFNIISEFKSQIKPRLYLKIHNKVSEILNLTMDELMKNGRSFEVVIREFMDWCGKDYIFCTWGCTDLVELQRNMKHYKIKYVFPKPFLFYDLQKLYSINFLDKVTRPTLSKAIEEQNIEADCDYHTAVNDARYSAQIMQILDFEAVRAYYSVDTYNIPSNKKEEVYLNFGEYGKYISRGFNSRENAATDRTVRNTKCYICNKSLKKHIKWFASGTKSYYGLFECEEHGFMRGRIRVKCTDNNKYFAIRTLRMIDEQGIQEIKDRKNKEKKRHMELRQKVKVAAQEG